MQEGITYLENSFPDVTIDIVTLVVNEIDNRSNDSDQRRILDLCHKSPGETYDIYQRTAIKRAWNSGTSIFQHEDPAKTDDVRAAYDKLARDVASQLQNVDTTREVNA